jgi:hypothetical protein
MLVRLVNRIKQAFEIIGPGFVQSDSFTITLLLKKHNFIPSTFFIWRTLISCRRAMSCKH